MPSVFLPFSEALVNKTTGPLTLWVDATLGNDANPGTQALPLATIIEAERRIPDLVFDDVFIRVLPGTYTPPTIRTRLMRRSIFVLGEGRTSVLVGTVDGGASTLAIPVTGGGLVANAHRGQYVEIASQRRLIISNTATTLQLCKTLSGAPVATTPLEIFLPPAVVLNCGAAPQVLLGNGTVGDLGISAVVAANGPGAWIYVNLRLTGSNVAARLIPIGRVVFYGVEMPDPAPRFFTPGSSERIDIGQDYDGLTERGARFPLLAGLTALLGDWWGYGLTVTDTAGTADLTFQNGAGIHFICAPSVAYNLGGSYQLQGGALFASTGITGAVLTLGSSTDGAGGRVSLASLSTAVQLALTGNSNQAVATVQSGTLSMTSTASVVTASGASGVGVLIQNLGVLLFSNGTVSGGQYGLQASRGGKVRMHGTGANVAGTTARHAVGPTPTTKNDNFTAGQVLRPTNYTDSDDSLFVRVS
jgi:hypothetical protein